MHQIYLLKNYEFIIIYKKYDNTLPKNKCGPTLILKNFVNDASNSVRNSAHYDATFVM